MYDAIDIYTLSANKIDLNHEIVDYYESHPDDPIIATVGEEKRIKIINRDSRIPGDHIIVPMSLTMKRYFQIPAAEIDILEQEVKDSGEGSKAVVTTATGGEGSGGGSDIWAGS